MGSLDKYIDNLDSVILKDYQEKRVKNISQELKNLINTYNKIVFICTHNSRRSQLCEVWAKILSSRLNLDLSFFSAGTEKTEVYGETIKSLKRAGIEFNIEGNNKLIQNKIELHSKTLDEIKEDEFISIMTCSDAEENCPVDPRSKKNLKLFYDDPKKYDGTIRESNEYDKTCRLIASELNAIFKKLVNPI
jgi:arsenate reductase